MRHKTYLSTATPGGGISIMWDSVPDAKIAVVATELCFKKKVIREKEVNTIIVAGISLKELKSMIALIEEQREKATNVK